MNLKDLYEDIAKQQPAAQNSEREQFRRDELESGLRGEEPTRAANEGTFYLRIDGRIGQRAGQPVAFQSRERAIQAGQTIKDRNPDREVVVTRRADDATPMAESRDPAYEDILTGLQKKLGDYLQDVATAVKQDPDLIDKLPQNAREIHAVKTIRTDDGHEIKIHGNEDQGFHISVKNQDIKSSFKDLDEAVMACEMYCSHRRKKAMEADYIEEETTSTGGTVKRTDTGLKHYAKYDDKKDDYDDDKLDKARIHRIEKATEPDDLDEADELRARGGLAAVNKKPGVSEGSIPFDQCPACRGPIFHESLMMEKQDACYHKVRSRYKVWPSAYASGALVQCRKKGAANWGTGSKK